MIFNETTLQGAYVLELEKREDDRGFFSRTFCVHEFQDHGLESTFVQGNMSRTVNKDTLRGMHYQVPPHEETKLVHCIRGAIYDVIVDIRADKPTYLNWFAKH